MSRRRSPEDVRAWLRRGPSLGELCEAYPREWETVERKLTDLSGRGEQALVDYVTALAAPAPRRSAAVPAAEIRRAMAAAALKSLCLRAASGVTSGRVRFNLVNGFAAQKLFFAHGLERKPVSLFWFRVIWPLLWQRRLLMPLVQPKGIYCFYSRRLIHELAEMTRGRRVLEIAAGDGTLSRFLADEGVQITATDNRSWSGIDYPATVVRQDARAALRAHQPEVVICSWPPAGNTFERAVFETPGVQLYLVINAGREFGSGNRADYRRQTAFRLTEMPELARLVLPTELEATVQIFRRAA